MLKADEVINPESCWNKALKHELVFVLLGRDVCAPAAIKFWCIMRVTFRKNKWRDKQIQEAWQLADKMKYTPPRRGPIR